MEKEILSILKSIQGDIKSLRTDVTELKSDVTELKSDVTELKSDVTELKSDVNGLKLDVIELKSGQERIERKLDGVFNQTADLTEFRTEVNSKLDKLGIEYHIVEEVTKENLYEIAKLKVIK